MSIEQELRLAARKFRNRMGHTDDSTTIINSLAFVAWEMMKKVAIRFEDEPQSESEKEVEMIELLVAVLSIVNSRSA